MSKLNSWDWLVASQDHFVCGALSLAIMHDTAKARRIKDVLADQVLIFIFAAELMIARRGKTGQKPILR